MNATDLRRKRILGARVNRAAAKENRAREELVAAIIEARSAGLSLRALAAASGKSVEWVRTVK